MPERMETYDLRVIMNITQVSRLTFPHINVINLHLLYKHIQIRANRVKKQNQHK